MFRVKELNVPLPSEETPSPHSAKKEQTLRFLGNEANKTLFNPLLFNLKIGLEVIAVVRSRFKYLLLL